jgi:hypothetical protein
MARQRIGAIAFTIGAVATFGWSVGALVTLTDLAIGAMASTYAPWLLAGVVPLGIAVLGVALYGGIPQLTLRSGCLGAAWGFGLLVFVAGVQGLLQGAHNVGLGGPTYQSEARVLVGAVIVEVLLTIAITAGVAVWRRRWFSALAAAATLMCILGVLDVVFIAMASAPF